MEENLKAIFWQEYNQSGIDLDKIFRRVCNEDEVVEVIRGGTLVFVFILHCGKVYTCISFEDEGMYMEEATESQKMQIIIDVLQGAKMKYYSSNLFDDETLKKLKSLQNLEFDVLCSVYQEKNEYSNDIFMVFSKCKPKGYEHCTIETDCKDEIMSWLIEHGVNSKTIRTKDLINAKRDIKNIIYPNTLA